ncbi:hypothetical protein BBJ28_00022857 [Nothophytophthora sp. Chile5]|nr:hypothetical protein BBJ28_00022857 [Nothophytophthora sp. Chile5]
MEEAYAVKQTQFLGKPVTYVCQNVNGPCPLLAIANVLLLRGHLSLDGLVAPPGVVSARDLMQAVQRRLVATNPPVRAEAFVVSIERLESDNSMLCDVAQLLPSLLVGLDVNVRFHKWVCSCLACHRGKWARDFEYTVACASFDMLDIALVHGWLLDEQDDKTMKVVGNKSYNELIERLVDYRAVLMTEEATKAATTEQQTETEVSPTLAEQEEELKAASPLKPTSATQTTGFHNLTIDIDAALASTSADAASSPSSSSASMTSPKKSPSQQTVQTMMKERHISDADALDTATTLLEEGPVLEEFFDSTASQLTYYGLVKLHEEVRERQLCVFFRNNHFSTLFKFQGALYLLVTDAGYLDEPTVVWERLNEIDGDTEYLDAQFRTVTASEQQQSILTQQQQQRDEEQQALREATALSLTGGGSTADDSEQVASGGDARAPEHTMPTGGLFGDHAAGNEGELHPDYLLALKFQREEEERVRGEKRVSPRISPHHLQPIGADREASGAVERSDDAGAAGDEEDDDEEEDEGRKNESSEQDDDGGQGISESEYIPVTVDGEIVVSEEELEAQRQAERFFQERKRTVDAQTLQYQQQQQQQQQQSRSRLQQPRRTSQGDGDCSIS